MSVSKDKIKIEGLTGDAAIAHALRQADLDVLAAYPITPQTIIVDVNRCRECSVCYCEDDWHSH